MKRLRGLNDRLSVGAKVGLLLFVMLLVAAVNVGAVYYYQSQVQTLGNSVDVAGGQPTLSQRMAYISFMISQGHDDGPLLNESIAKFNRNLEAISEGGTVRNATLQAAPSELEDELEAERSAWEKYEEHARTVATEPSYNPDFRRSLSYLTDHRDELLRQSEEVIRAYESMGGNESYTEEVDVAGRQQMLSQQITALALEISSRTSRPGTEARMKLEMQEDERMQAIKANLSDRIEAFDEALIALERGGTYRGIDLSPAPSSVQTEIEDLRETWKPFRVNATTLATTDRLNPDFWNSLAYVEDNSNHLRSVSADAVTEFAAVSTNRIGWMQALLLVLLGVDVIIFLGGTVIGRRYIGNPINEVAGVADQLASGSLDVDEDVLASAESPVDPDDRRDEIRQLRSSFRGLHGYLTTVAGQARALAKQDFDADVLDESVPGEFGKALDQMQADLETLIAEMEEANEEARAAQKEAEELSASMERTAEEFGAVMAEAADGDLTQRMDTSTEHEAMNEIATAFNNMVAQLERTIGSVQAFAGEVASASEAVTESAREVKEAGDEVGRSVQEITDGTSEQSEKLQQVSEEMNDLSATIEEVASRAETVAGTAKETADVGREGQEASEEAIEEMRRIKASTEESVAAVSSLHETVAEIGQIIDLIADVAEQTNMLALNANIEAARAAGEGGEGFDVVANEVKQLANETKESAGEIESLIEEVQERTESTVEEIETAEERVERGTETVADAVDAFERMVDDVGQTHDGISEISDATDDQANSTQEAVAMVDDVAAISQQTSAEAETVASTAEEQTAALQEVAQQIEDLADRADDLQGRAEVFEVDESITADDGTAEQESAVTDGGPGSKGS